MPPNEKEYNGNLFDQLTVIERIERQPKRGEEEAAKVQVSLGGNF